MIIFIRPGLRVFAHIFISFSESSVLIIWGILYHIFKAFPIFILYKFTNIFLLENTNYKAFYSPKSNIYMIFLIIYFYDNYL